jgi:hypothetical protein
MHRTAGPCLVRRPCGFSLCSAHLADPPTFRLWGALIALVTCQTKVVHQCCPRQQAPSPAAVEVCHSSLHTSCSVLRLSQACSTQRRMLLVEPALPASAEVS